jgi:hypothetical protein
MHGIYGLGAKGYGPQWLHGLFSLIRSETGRTGQSGEVRSSWALAQVRPDSLVVWIGQSGESRCILALAHVQPDCPLWGLDCWVVHFLHASFSSS